MRLAQLARRISVKPSEISEFLASKNIVIENSSNAKVNDDHVELVLGQFAPELLNEKQIEAESEPEVGENIVESEVEAIEPDQKIDPQSESETETSGKEEVQPEVIKPVKVELPGLKVVGKIDLPEPKKKEEVSESDTQDELKNETPAAEQAQNKPPRDNRRKPRSKRDQDRRPRKNPIALQREREEREAMRKKLEAKEKEKELRTQRYLKKVSAKVTPPKPVRRANHEDDYEVFEEEAVKPKTFFKKVVNWFVSK